MGTEHQSGAPPVATIRLASFAACLAAAALAYEILLLRILAIAHWPHFVALVVSLALLGFGASGSFLAVSLPRAKTPRLTLMARHAAACAIALPLATALAARVPFNALELLWDPRQFGWFAVLFAVCTVPFFFAANALALALIEARAGAGRVYAADLAGSGFGAVLALALLELCPLPIAVSCLGVLAAIAALAVAGAPRRVTLGGGLCLAAFAAASLAPIVSPPQPSPYKAESRALAVLGAKKLGERYGPLGRLTAVASPRVPFRHAPGLSLASTAKIPPQLAIFTDGDAPTYVTADVADAAWLADLPTAWPYLARPAARALVIGAGGGLPVLQALRLGAVTVTAVEPNGDLLAWVREDFGAAGGALYADPRVSVHVGDARGFLARATGEYDVILVPASGAFGAPSAGVGAFSESLVHTREAFAAFLDRLSPGGLLVLESGLTAPPRAPLRLVATAAEVLRARHQQPGEHLALWYGWNTAVLAVGRDPLTPALRASLQAFCAARQFDIAWPADDGAPRYVIWDRPWLHEGVAALVGETAEAFIDRYKFDITPVSDDRPFFHDFFRWRLIPEFLRLGAQSGPLLFESGHLLIATALVQALLLGTLLILAPVALRLRRAPDGRMAIYFTALGAGFLAIEIACVHRLALVLGHPVYAATTALATFLVAAGLGSAASASWRDRFGRHAVRYAALAVALAAPCTALAIDLAAEPLMAQAFPLRIVASIGLLAPLAFLLGMPFPLGLARLMPDEMPWAWALNGCASVVGALLATLIAMQIGFTGVMGCAAALYLLAARVAR
ncbi:MAG TPA: SAM-dependent methyltransferase [Gammaproteobacteria bacterium]|nr:SAM-dependent methyltransferase [Gammaproteobacteria bacterium]